MASRLTYEQTLFLQTNSYLRSYFVIRKHIFPHSTANNSCSCTVCGVTTANPILHEESVWEGKDTKPHLQ